MSDSNIISSSQPLLELREVSRYFNLSKSWLDGAFIRQKHILKAVDQVSFTLNRGETLALVGESGCGKSTLARLVAGLYHPTSGNIIFEGMDLSALKARKAWELLRQRMQMIFQDPYASLNPRWQVADIVAEPIRVHGLLSKHAIENRVHELLIQVGMSPSDGKKYPHAFSGGQRQRISIARALASEPEFIICDEPTSALDVSVQAQILNLMKDLQSKQQLTYLFISHNLAIVRYLADRVAVMQKGRIVEIASTSQLFTNPQHPYTRMLLDSIPSLEMF